MNQLVFIKNDRVLTDSLTIASVFGKEHKEVLRDIDKQLSKLDEAGEKEWGLRNFAHTHYTHKQNKQRYRKFLLTEDAFAIIAMSYVTPKAMKMKVMFLNEFRKMKEKLQNKFNLPTTYKEALLQLVEKEEENERITTENAMYKQQIAEYEPKVTYVDEILKSTDLMTVSQIADDYGMSARQFNKLLKELGIQFKQSGQWFLYSKYKGNGYTKSETTPYTHKDGRSGINFLTKWTQKGRLFLYEYLKSKNILPTMEQMKMEFYLEQKEGAEVE